MEHFLDFIKSFGWLAAVLVNLLIVWVAWSLRHKFVTREDCAKECGRHATAREKMCDTLASHDKAMRELSLKLEILPDQGRLHEIELKLARIEGEQGRLVEELRGMRGLLERIENQSTLLIRDRMEGAQ